MIVERRAAQPQLVIRKDKVAEIEAERAVKPEGDNWLARLQRNLRPGLVDQFAALELRDDEECKHDEEDLKAPQPKTMSRLEQDVRDRLKDCGTGKLLRQVRELLE